MHQYDTDRSGTLSTHEFMDMIGTMQKDGDITLSMRVMINKPMTEVELAVVITLASPRLGAPAPILT